MFAEPILNLERVSGNDPESQLWQSCMAPFSLYPQLALMTGFSILVAGNVGRHQKLVPLERIELPPDAYKATARPSCYRGKNNRMIFVARQPKLALMFAELIL